MQSTKAYRPGATGALLDEYERAIADLQQTIADISDDELTTVVDSKTTDTRCRSIQTILAHVVGAGHRYAVYIRQLKGQLIEQATDIFRLQISDYKKDLDDMFAFNVDTFATVHENEVEETDSEKKILTRWGQSYDIEQITEHAIVHILRHRRQIEKFKLVLRAQQ